MPNKLSTIIDYYFEVIGEEPSNYTRHLRAAKSVLELCDGDVDKSIELIDKTRDWVEGFGTEWTLDTCIKYYANECLKAGKI